MILGWIHLQGSTLFRLIKKVIWYSLKAHDILTVAVTFCRFIANEARSLDNDRFISSGSQLVAVFFNDRDDYSSNDSDFFVRL
jgi:hypothetical protein